MVSVERSHLADFSTQEFHTFLKLPKQEMVAFAQGFEAAYNKENHKALEGECCCASLMFLPIFFVVKIGVFKNVMYFCIGLLIFL
jgi:hypothetical protein